MSGANRPQETEPTEPETALETARYIADLTSGMSAMARRSGLDVLAYLLQVARLEAEETVHSLKSGRSG